MPAVSKAGGPGAVAQQATSKGAEALSGRAASAVLPASCCPSSEAEAARRRAGARAGGFPCSSTSTSPSRSSTPTTDGPSTGKQFLKDYSAKYGETSPDRYAVYGYESMTLLLEAIKRAGDNGGDRAAVADQLLATKNRKGVFGTYSLDPNGDITLTPYGIYKIKDGALAFDHSIDARL